MVESEVYEGTLYSTMSQEVVFKKPGTYNIPVLHVTEDATTKEILTSKNVGEVQVVVTNDTNEKLEVAYTGTGSKFDLTQLSVTGNITGEKHGISLDTEQLFIFNDNNNKVDENYVMAPGTTTTLHVTYYPNRMSRLLNNTVHYGSTVPTTPPTGLANYAGYYVMLAGFAAVVLVIARKTRKENN